MSHKTAFITGSAKRLGAHTARLLHSHNYNIVLHCHRSVDEANALKSALNSVRAESCELVVGDLCQLNSLQEISKGAISAFGRLDLLVNNASSFYPTPIGEIGEQDWQSLVGSNMQAPLFLSQWCAESLRANQGAIVNMVDIHAERPLKNHTVYCMAKAGLVAMTKSLAQELAPDVRVNGVAPGAILWPEQSLSEASKADILSQIPAARIGTPQDIAETIYFLATSPYVTGQILAVDGGRSIASGSDA